MSNAYPLRLDGDLDLTTSRWLWIIKWLLIIPQVLVLALLALVSVFAWIGAFFAILFTTRYPRGLFAFNVGVLRWAWRVSFYSLGAFATDRYPPFTLEDRADYPARLDVDYPEHLNRWLPLVKWFLAIPHLVVVAILVGASSNGTNASNQRSGWSNDGSTIGLISVLAVVAVVVLAFNARYPRDIFDLLMGLQRWVFRVYAYMMLMTDEYPPFRLDSGGRDPATAPSPPAAPQDQSG